MPGSLGKIEIDDHKIGTIDGLRLERPDIADGVVAVSYEQKVALDAVLLKGLAHQTRIRQAILDQKNGERLLTGILLARLFRTGS
jgi:hypothetical protein